MEHEIKYEVVRGKTYASMAATLRNKYPNLVIISKRVFENYNLVHENERDKRARKYKVYFIEDVDKLVAKIDKEVNEK